jgi:hypothetical protein
MIREPIKQPDGSLPEANDERLAQLVDELAEQLCEGRNLDWPACLLEHPREAAALQELAPAIEVLAMFRRGGASSV